MVFGQTVRMQHVGANLASPGDVHLGVFDSLAFGTLLLELHFIQAGPQHLHGGGAVLVLRSFVLALNDDAGGNVGDAHGRIGGIDVLASGTGCTVSIDAKILVLDNDLNLIVNFRIDKY